MARKGYTEEVTFECFWPRMLRSTLDGLEQRFSSRNQTVYTHGISMCVMTLQV